MGYFEQMNNLETQCTSSSQMRTLYHKLQSEVITTGVLDTYYEEMCDVKLLKSSAEQAFLQTYTTNTLVLCEVCKTIKASNSVWPSICPWEELCNCQTALAKVLATTVWQRCKPSQAYYDVWHRWASAFIVCLWKPDIADAYWLANATAKQELADSLLGYGSSS